MNGKRQNNNVQIIEQYNITIELSNCVFFHFVYYSLPCDRSSAIFFYNIKFISIMYFYFVNYFVLLLLFYHFFFVIYFILFLIFSRSECSFYVLFALSHLWCVRFGFGSMFVYFIYLQYIYFFFSVFIFDLITYPHPRYLLTMFSIIILSFLVPLLHFDLHAHFPSRFADIRLLLLQTMKIN